MRDKGGVSFENVVCLSEADSVGFEAFFDEEALHSFERGDSVRDFDLLTVEDVC